MPNTGRQIAKGAAWMVLFKLTERGLGLISTVILARLLIPQTLGGGEGLRGHALWSLGDPRILPRQLGRRRKVPPHPSRFRPRFRCHTQRWRKRFL